MTKLKERTLKHVYEQRAAREDSHQLLEAVDKQALQQVTAALDKLEGIVPNGANLFNQAIEAAKADLGNYLKGGVKQFFKNLAGDPVLKATSFANAIRQGLSSFPTIARLYLPKGTEKEQQRSVLELIPREKQKQFLDQVAKAFEPESNVDVTSLFRGNSMPYVQNLQAAVQELFQNIAPNGGFKLSQQASAQPPAQVQQAATATQGQTSANVNQAPSATSSVETKPTAQTQAAANTAPTIDAKATQQSQTSSTGKRLTAKDKPAIDDLAAYLTRKTGVDQATLAKVLTQLANDQKLLG